MGPGAGPVGVLAVQGGFAAHLRALDRLGRAAREVRAPADLDGLAGLILPGGESTAQLRLIERLGLLGPLRAFADGKRPILATCAGLILLARVVHGGSMPAPPGLGLLDVEVRRNAWGRQVDSFAATSDEGRPLLFIRAPRITEVGRGVHVRARLRGEPVLVQQGAITAATFHPELTEDLSVHRDLFVTA